MSDAVLSILCLVATLVLYYANKKLGDATNLLI